MEQGFAKIEKGIERKFVERPLMVEGVGDKQEFMESKEKRQAREEIAEELEKDRLSLPVKVQARMVAGDIQEESIERRIQRLMGEFNDLWNLLMRRILLSQWKWQRK
jgi:imidazoleglycerol phosphate synthase glutamine amidotransferase subunit HisH